MTRKYPVAATIAVNCLQRLTKNDALAPRMNIGNPKISSGSLILSFASSFVHHHYFSLVFLLVFLQFPQSFTSLISYALLHTLGQHGRRIRLQTFFKRIMIKRNSLLGREAWLS